MALVGLEMDSDNEVRERYNETLPFKPSDLEALLEGVISPDNDKNDWVYFDLADFTSWSGKARDAHTILDTVLTVADPVVKKAREYRGRLVSQEGDGFLLKIPARYAGALHEKMNRTLARVNPISIPERGNGSFEHEISVEFGAAGGKTYEIVVGDERRRHHIVVGKPLEKAREMESSAKKAGHIVLDTESLPEMAAYGGEDQPTGEVLSMPNLIVPGISTVTVAGDDDYLLDMVQVLPFYHGGDELASHEFRDVTSMFTSFRRLEELVLETIETPTDEGLERLKALLNEFYAGITKIIEGKNGGYIDMASPSKFLAHIGTHGAHGDDELRGINAMFEVQEYYHEFLERHDLAEEKLSVGIESGEVCVGAPYNRIEVLGNSVNLAARLEAHARESGYGIVVGETVMERVRDNVDESRSITPLPSASLKGVSKTIIPTEITGIIRPDRKHDTTYVGRQQERNLLETVISRVEGGEAVRVGISGPAGIGKSYFVQQVLEELRERDWNVYQGRASLVDQGTPFKPIVDILEQIIGIGNQGRAAARSRIRRFYDNHEVADVMVDLLGVGESSLAAMDADRKRGLILNGVQSALGADEGNSVVYIEDLYLADNDTKRLLKALGIESNLLLLPDYRKGSNGGAFDPSGFIDEEIELAAMADDDTSSIVREIYQRNGVSSVRDSDVAVVVKKAEGRPLFAKKLARKVVREIGIESGQFVREVENVEFDGEIRSLIMEEYDAYDGREKSVMKYLAVMGGRVDLRVAQELLGDEYATLESLVRNGSLDKKVEGITTVSFDHGSFAEVIESTLTPDPKAQLHHEAARAYHTVFENDNESLERRAYHLRKSGITQDGAYKDNKRLQESITCTLEHAEYFLTTSSDTASVVKNFEEIADEVEALNANDTHFVRAKLFRNLAEIFEAREPKKFHDYVKLAKEETDKIEMPDALDRPETLGFEYVAAADAHAHSLTLQAADRESDITFDNARKAAADAVSTARELGDDYLLAKTLRHQAAISGGNSHSILTEAQGAIERSGKDDADGKREKGRILYRLGEIEKRRGNYEDAISLFDESYGLFDETDDRSNILATENARSDLYRTRASKINDENKKYQDLADAEQSAYAALEEAERLGYKKEEAAAITNLGEASELRGDLMTENGDAQKQLYTTAKENYKKAQAIFTKIGRSEYAEAVNNMLQKLEEKRELKNKNSIH
jgi:class 3 adenylate cyclase/tetratricopeptide (TPR) repeat protein